MRPKKSLGQTPNYPAKAGTTGQDFLTLKPKKSLGQVFLHSKRVVEDIICAADLKPDDIVLEVGPGKGILTEAILEKIGNPAGRGKLIAIEKDERMVEFLKEKFKNQKKIEIIYGDILKIDFKKLMKPKANEAKPYKIVANIPYYITSHFLRRFLESDYQPSRMVLMVQKEVAERIACPVKKRKIKKIPSSIPVTSGKDSRRHIFDFSTKESILSISVKVYGEPKIIRTVPASFFSPKPKVDSAILLIDNISKEFFSKEVDEKKFFEIVKKGFAQKRKMLKNNLKLLNTECLIKCGIEENARAENLSPENWKCLLDYFNRKNSTIKKRAKTK